MNLEKQTGGKVCPESDVFIEEQLEKPEDKDGEVQSEFSTGQSDGAESLTKRSNTELKQANDANDANNAPKAGPETRVGRWSRHSRIVSANRALFEGMASDVARIGLFEAGPVADPVLLENSERILNKVQTLARMYSEKASHAKLQRRGVFGQSWMRGGGSQSQSGCLSEGRGQKKNRQRAEPPASADHVTSTVPLSFNGISPSRLCDRSSKPERIAVGCDDSIRFNDKSSFKENNSRVKESSLFGKPPPAPSGSCKVMSCEYLEEPRSGPPHPPEVPQNDSLPQGNRTSAVAWGGNLTHSRSLHKNDASQTCVRDQCQEDSTGSGLPVHFPQEHVNTAVENVKNTSEEEATEVKQPSTVFTTRQTQKDAPCLGTQTPHTPLMIHGGSSDEFIAEFPQNLVPYLGYTSRNKANTKPTTSTAPHPDFTEAQAQEDARHVGCQGQDVPLSELGGLKMSSNSADFRVSSVQSPVARQKEAAEKGLPVQSPREQAGETLKHIDSVTSVKDEAAEVHQASTMFTRGWAQNDAPRLEYPNQDVPLFKSGSPRASCTGAEVIRLSVRSPVVHEQCTMTGQERNATMEEERNTTTGCEQRERSMAGPSPRSSSRPGSDSPALAALLPSPARTSTSAFKPTIQRCDPDPTNYNQCCRDSPKILPRGSHTPDPTRRSPSPAPNPIPCVADSPQPLSTPSSPALRPGRSTTAFTRSLAASCISQSISLSMSKQTLDKSSSPVPLPSTYHLRQRSPSPKLSVEANQYPRSFLWSSQALGNHPQKPNTGHSLSNANNNNSYVSSHSTNGTGTNWAGANVDPSHNRVARPFCTSEPNSRVQSPTSFSHFLPQHDLSSPLANKPPAPRRPGSTHNPLGLTLDINRAVSCSSSLSPRVTSPPPIGVSLNVWTKNIAAPQPRNARFSPSASPTSAYPTSLRNSRNASSSPPFSPILQSSLRRSHSVTLADRYSSTLADRHSTALSDRYSTMLPDRYSNLLADRYSTTLADRVCTDRHSASLLERAASPVTCCAARSSTVARRSWVENSRRSLTFNGPFDQHEAGLLSPRNGHSLSALSPQAALQSPVSPGRFSPAKSTFAGQQFAGVPWSDEISRSFSDSSTSEVQTWSDSEPEEGPCRSQIICPYVSRPPRPPGHSPQNHSSSSPITSPAQAPPINIKPANQRTSYATTVNLQIAGSGRIKSFSTAQVSLTQTLQSGPQTQQGVLVRRVSVHGLPQ